tara:strand:- start:82 stop:597 length:516 start_codon:yes stop_codon:yes gene_type:complete
MLYDSDPRLWGYFIEGSDGHLNENANNERMVSNGTPVKFHSVTLGTEEGEAGDDAAADMATDEARLNAAGAGDEIILNSPPYSVNVSLVLAEGTTAKEYDDVSLVPGGAVLPVMKLAARVSSFFFLGLINLVLTTPRTSRRNSMDSRQRQLRPLSLRKNRETQTLFHLPRV